MVTSLLAMMADLAVMIAIGFSVVFASTTKILAFHVLKEGGARGLGVLTTLALLPSLILAGGI
jgi:hypothetical protein